MKPSRSPDSPRDTRRRRRPQRWLWIACVAWLVVRLALALIPTVPRQLDELGYLSNARHLATGTDELEPSGRSPYKVGYSLLLVPAYLIADDDAGAFLLVRVINAVLLAALLPLAALLARRFDPELPRADQVLIGAAVALSPAAVLYGTTAMSEALLMPGYLLYLLLARRALGTGGARAWLAWGAMAGFLYLVHERAVGWLALALVAAVVVAVSRRRRSPLLLLPPAVVLARLELVLPFLQIPGTTWPTGRSAAGILGGLGDQLPALAATLAGQLWYVGLATMGVVFAGVGVVIVRRGTWQSPFHWLVVASSGSMVALSVLSMAQREEARITHWLYGRYNEAVLPALVVLSLVALLRATPRMRLRASGIALGLLAVCPLALRSLWTPKMGDPYSFNVPALAVYDALVGWGLFRAGLFGLALAAVFLALLHRRPRAALVAFVLWQAAASVAGFFDADWQERAEWRAREHHLATIVHTLAEQEVIPPDATICYDRRTFPGFHSYHYDFHLPRFDLRLAGGTAECDGELWISPDLDSAPVPGARLVALETLPPTYPPFQQRLWVRSGPLQRLLDERGWLFPADFPAPLGTGALAGEIRRLDDRVGDDRGTGHRVTGDQGPRIEIRNRGNSPWPHALGLRRHAYRVALRARWTDPASADVLAESTVELPRLLLPGESQELRLPALAPDGLPLPPGRYVLHLEIDQYLPEGWSKAAGRARLETEIGIGSYRDGTR